MLAFTLGGTGDDADLHVMFNMGPEALDFDLPPLTGRGWWRSVDTSQASPADILEAGSESAVAGSQFRVSGRSVVVLVSRNV